jgi:hypothetical protein
VSGFQKIFVRETPGTEQLGEKMAFLAQNTAKLCQYFITTLVFEKNANIFDENWQKS